MICRCQWQQQFNLRMNSSELIKTFFIEKDVSEMSSEGISLIVKAK